MTTFETNAARIFADARLMRDARAAWHSPE